MRQSLFIAAAAIALAGYVGVSYAHDGEIVTQNRDLPAFDKLEASRGVEVTLSCGPEARAVLHGDSKAVGNIELLVEDHTLIVRRASAFHIGFDDDPVQIQVATPQPLGRYAASSGSSVRAPACAVASGEVDFKASSGATLKVAGKMEHLRAEVSSGATINRLDGARIDAGDAELRASSGGTLRVCTIGHMNGKASSGGSVTTEDAGSGERSSSSGGDFSTRRCD